MMRPEMMRRRLVISVLAHLLCFTAFAAKPLFNNPIPFEKDALKDFSQLYYVTQDLSGTADKALGAPSVLLQAFGERLSEYLPTSRRHSAGCLILNNDIVGVGAQGSYDLLLPPNKEFGPCVTPSNKTTMRWHGDYPDRTSYEKAKSLPTAEQVWKTVFARKEHRARNVPEGQPSLNFWFLSFVNWFHDDNFRTEPETDGTYTWSNVVGLRLSQVYGHTEYRQTALRTFSNGKMKVQTVGKWAYYPPSYASIRQEFPEFEMWTPETGPGGVSAAAGKNDTSVDIQTYFAIGDPRFNMHPGHVLWASIGLYLHNNACDAILRSDPELNDEEVFQRARTLVFHAVQKTRVHQFIFDSVAHTRDHFRIEYDPPTIRRDIGAFLNFRGGIPNYLEFNHIYQAWHSFIPDELHLANNESIPMNELMWNPDLFHQRPLSEIAIGFAKTPVAQYGPHNFLQFLEHVTIQAIHDERAQRLQSYNTYRENFGLQPLTSFEALGVDSPNDLAELYNHDIDSLELLPGIVADNKASLPGNLLGDMQLIMVTLLAVEDLSSNDVISNPMLWSEEYLTRGGLEFLQQYDFPLVLELMLDGAMATPKYTFRASDEGCTSEQDWVAYNEAPKCFLCMSSVCSYIGVDVTEWFYDNNGYMRYLVIAHTLALAIVACLYVAIFALLRRIFPRNAKKSDNDTGNETDSTNFSHVGSSISINAIRRTSVSSILSSTFLDRVRICVLVINSLVTLTLCIPVTWFWIQLVGNPNWLADFSDSTYSITCWAVAFTSAIFLAEVVARLSFVDKQGYTPLLIMLAHHLLYYYLVVAVLATADVMVYKVAITILTGFVWEWPLYCSTLSLRGFDALTIPRQELYKQFLFYRLPVLLAIYLLTRIIETIVVIQLIVCGVRRYFGENAVDSTPFWIVAPIAMLPVLFQFHAGWRLFLSWRRRVQRLEQTESSSSSRATRRASAVDASIFF